jgi:SAM-dependent methyltransferase
MLYTRYSFSSRFCEGKEVLELGCGSGMGLGYLAQHARRVVGGDYTESMLLSAQGRLRGHVPLVRLDAHSLPFKDDSFDVVVLFEALYYLARPQEFLKECRRVLRGNGTLLMCSANREWKGFSPSALSEKYFSSSELRELLAENHFDSEIFGGFPASADSLSEKVTQAVRGLAVRLNLIPRTMRGKELLKQIFFGRLIRLGAAVEENMAEIEALIPIRSGRRTSPRFKVLYVLGRARPKSSTWLETQRVLSVRP